MTVNSTLKTPVNPYRELITACGNDLKRLQEAYDNHRLKRNAQFRERILSPQFQDWQFDEILHNVLRAEQGLTDFVDPRHNLGFWTRPPRHIRDFVHDIQQEIVAVAGSSLWLMPPENLHMTTLEMMSACTAPEVDELVSFLQQKAPLQDLVDYTLTRHARLGRPIVSYDASALALSFLPMAANNGDSLKTEDCDYTYHHLRSDLYDKVIQCGCQIGARYTVPSAHITIARFTVPINSDPVRELELLSERAVKLVEKIEDINKELSSTRWERFGNPSRGEWIVGQEQGLELNKGVAWYGTGTAVLRGEGIPKSLH